MVFFPLGNYNEMLIYIEKATKDEMEKLQTH